MTKISYCNLRERRYVKAGLGLEQREGEIGDGEMGWTQRERYGLERERNRWTGERGERAKIRMEKLMQVI